MRILLALIFIAFSILLLRFMTKFKWIVLAVYIAAIVYFAFLIREPTPIYHYSFNLFGAARKRRDFERNSDWRYKDSKLAKPGRYYTEHFAVRSEAYLDI